MTRILYIGYEPDSVDYSDPVMPPGTTPDKLRAANAFALKQFADRGWEADMFYIRPDGTAGTSVARQLDATRYNCVVVGAGVRFGISKPRRLGDLEAVINAVHKGAPDAGIGFNLGPEDSADAAARGLPKQ